MNPDLNNIEAAARAAQETAPGPWRLHDRCKDADPDRACGVTTEHKNKHGHIVDVFHSDAYDECSHLVSLVAAQHIAQCSPDVVLAMVTRIRALEAALRMLRDAARMSFGALDE